MLKENYDFFKDALPDFLERRIDKEKKFINSFVIETVAYFITITLKPLFHKLSVEAQYNTTRPKISQLFNATKCSYLLYPEITKEGNIHYHGIINIINKTHLAILKDKCKSLFGLNQFKPITDSMKSHLEIKRYIAKDMILTRSMVMPEKVMRLLISKQFDESEYRKIIRQEIYSDSALKFFNNAKYDTKPLDYDICTDPEVYKQYCKELLEYRELLIEDE